jgi:hemerythrin-like metal-binding protein
MVLLNWNDKLSVGVESIDEQHRVLVETLNELYRAIMKGEPRNSTGPLLRNLLAYTRNHYAAEEQMLASANYPELRHHQFLHREMLQMLRGHLASFERGEGSINVDFLYFLRDWLTNHIQNVDGGYRTWLVEHGMALAATVPSSHTSNESWVEPKSGAGFGSDERS